MIRYQFLRGSVVLLAGLALMVSGGCKTKRVYLDDSPRWIQQATGEVDLGFGTGWEVTEWPEEEQAGQTHGRMSRQQSGSERQPASSAEGPPSVQFGPPQVSVQVEGEDY